MQAPPLDPTRCPDCTQPHGGGARCAQCGLLLTGPLAAELWQVDTSIAALRGRRTQLIAALRSRTEQPATSASWSSPATVAYPAPARQATWTPPAPQRTEWTPKRVQNLLLSLGVLLLAVAAVIFTAVTWGSLGIGGRAAIMATVTAAAGAAAPVALRRKLPATAEAMSTLAVLLLVIDAYGARRSFPALRDVDGLVFWAAATAVIAAACALYAGLVPLRTPRVAAAAFALLPVPLLAARSDDLPTAALLLLAQAGVSAAGAWVRRPGDDAARVLRAGALGSGAVGSALAGVQAFPWEPVAADVLRGAGLLVLAAMVSVLTGWLRRDARTIVVVSGGRAAFALILAVVALARISVAVDALPAAAAVTGAIVVVASMALRDWERGPLVVGTATVGLALLVDGIVAGLAAVLPLGWLADVWGLTDVGAAATATPGGHGWPGTAAVLVTLSVAAAVAWLLGRRFGRDGEALLVGGPLVVLGLATVPVALGWTYAAAVGWDLALGVAALAAAWRLAADRRRLAVAVALAGAGLLTVAVGWSLANEPATLAALAVSAVAAGGLATRSSFRLPAAAASGGLAMAWVFAQSLSAGADVPASALALAVAACAVVGVATVLRHDGHTGAGLEVTAAAAYAGSVLLAAEDPDLLSVVLALGGVVALAVALRSDRRHAVYAALALLSCCLWVRLAVAGVDAPEPYVVPPALAALVLGHLRRRADVRVGSWSAYGPGLALGLLPTLYVVLSDPGLSRPLALAAAATVVLLLGVRDRLQAPLVLGGGALAIDALVQIAPYAAALPRWVSIGTVGLLLVAVGATYEQRLRDLRRIQDRFDSLA